MCGQKADRGKSITWCQCVLDLVAKAADDRDHHVRFGMRQALAVAVIALLLGAALFLLHERTLLAIGDFLVIQDELVPADVIHVIAGADYRTDPV